MAVRIGNIELVGVQDVYTDEARTLVEQRVPDQQGSVFQDLGRDPVTITLEGILFDRYQAGQSADDRTDAVLRILEALRAAQAGAEPQSFAADIAVGTELTDVVIEDVKFIQVAGYRSRYRFTIRLREYTAPPEPAGTAIAPVNANVEADAAAWASGGLAAGAVLQDPGSLGDALANQPDLLDHLSMDDLGASIAQNVDSLTGGAFNDILDAVSSVDLETVMDLVQAVRDADSLGDFLTKLADENLDLPFDIGTATALVKALAGGLDFLKKLKNVSDQASKLANDLTDFDPLAGLRPLLD
ncbi:MAG: hypothetical protein MJE77_33045 [Proteobacteria bacterium]|nr:hypothetical protein [Pseudomonadota bacterium]